MHPSVDKTLTPRHSLTKSESPWIAPHELSRTRRPLFFAGPGRLAGASLRLMRDRTLRPAGKQASMQPTRALTSHNPNGFGGMP